MSNIYLDDFERTTGLGSAWTEVQGTWATDGEARGTIVDGTDDARIVVPYFTWLDRFGSGVYSCRVRKPDPKDSTGYPNGRADIGIFICDIDPTNAVLPVLALQKKRIEFLFEEKAGDLVLQYRMGDGSTQLIASQAFSWADGETKVMKLTAYFANTFNAGILDALVDEVIIFGNTLLYHPGNLSAALDSDKTWNFAGMYGFRSQPLNTLNLSVADPNRWDNFRIDNFLTFNVETEPTLEADPTLSGITIPGEGTAVDVLEDQPDEVWEETFTFRDRVAGPTEMGYTIRSHLETANARESRGVSWSNISSLALTAIRQLASDVDGVNIPFSWTPPGESLGTWVFANGTFSWQLRASRSADRRYDARATLVRIS